MNREAPGDTVSCCPCDAKSIITQLHLNCFHCLDETMPQGVELCVISPLRVVGCVLGAAMATRGVDDAMFGALAGVDLSPPAGVAYKNTLPVRPGEKEKESV